MQCLGVARALGVEPEIRHVAPRVPWAWIMPWGPIDPREAPDKPGSPLRPPYPDIVIASGRRTVPALRVIRKESGGKTFTVFLKYPRTGKSAADFIWVPQHDSLRGRNVMTTLTSPHSIRPDILNKLRNNPDPRLMALAAPRVAVILGGNDRRRHFSAQDNVALAGIVESILRSGHSIMMTPSRRTPAELTQAIKSVVSATRPGSAFVWDGSGENPYRAMLALADAILVTGDSVNMIGEAAATGAPVHIFEPSGDAGKLRVFIDGLIARGAARRWTGAIESWTYPPIDATDEIAREIQRRFTNARLS